uniref:COesterase domain-containing protein n=1 Tax=Parastrongyloides trichosuri TaxID=131310 RepID=A0A0N5A6T1_PARTI
MSESINNLLAGKEPSFFDSATRITAIALNCSSSTQPKNHKKIFECLLNKTAEDIMKYSEQFSLQVDMPTILGENIILNDTIFFNGSLYLKFLTGEMKQNVDVLFVDKFYNASSEQSSMRENATRFLTDVTGRCHLMDFARKVSTEIHGTFYSYYFNTSSSGNNWPKWMVSTHGDELDYVFGLPFRYPEEYNKTGHLEQEKKLSEKIINMIKKFTEEKGFYSTWDKFTDTYRKGVSINVDFDPEKKLPILDDMESENCRALLPYLLKYLMYHGDLKVKIEHPTFNDTELKEQFNQIKYANEEYYNPGNESVYYESIDSLDNEKIY